MLHLQPAKSEYSMFVNVNLYHLLSQNENTLLVYKIGHDLQDALLISASFLINRQSFSLGNLMFGVIQNGQRIYERFQNRAFY